MTPPPFAAPATASTPTAGQRFRAGGWYFVLTIGTAGFLAAVPFWHAATRLGRRDVRVLALAYTAADVYLVVLLALTPPQQADGTSGNETLSTIGGFSALLVVVLACIQLRSPRRAVYGAPGAVPVHDDPTVVRALGARDRRDQTRQLIAQNPDLQREFGIGRPDLGRGYDDGGLVHVNSAPVEVFVRAADIDRPTAEATVAARTARGGSFYDLAELVDSVSLPAYAREQLQERALFP